MRILFLTINRIDDISSRGIYKDLMRKFRDEKHDVYIATPIERRFKEKTRMNKIDGVTILMIKTLNITQSNLIEKGLATILIEYQFLKAIKKFFADNSFDLVLFSTPPITFSKVINYFKQKDKALTYLLLKDIFPQNAVDLEMIKKNSLLHRYFRKKEKRLYNISDYIGCMSPANAEFICKHNQDIDSACVEVNPNSLEPIEIFIDLEGKNKVRQKFNIPVNSTIFIYGGNLGKPQGIDFLIEVLESQSKKTNVFFIIAGSGTEYARLRLWFKQKKPNNALLLDLLPRSEFEELLRACDIGMIFLDKRFTIPNFPSRLLSYIENKMPIIAATDKNTDLGKIIEDNEFGFWSEAGDIIKIDFNINKLAQNHELISNMGKNGYNFFLNNYTVTHSYNKIMSHLHF